MQGTHFPEESIEPGALVDVPSRNELALAGSVQAGGRSPTDHEPWFDHLVWRWVLEQAGNNSTK